MLTVADETDCCCRHEGHKTECACVYCKKPRCCAIHHGPNSDGTACAIERLPACCDPEAPHRQEDKFVLLPGKKSHNDKVFEKLRKESLNSNRCYEQVSYGVPNNIESEGKCVLFEIDFVAIFFFFKFLKQSIIILI